MNMTLQNLQKVAWNLAIIVVAWNLVVVVVVVWNLAYITELLLHLLLVLVDLLLKAAERSNFTPLIWIASQMDFVQSSQ